MSALSSPFVGLAPFDESSRRYFCARDKEIALVTANASASRLTVFYGPSGAGKSSILSAGLVPILKEQRAPREGASAPRPRPSRPVPVLWREWAGDARRSLGKAIADALRECGLGESKLEFPQAWLPLVAEEDEESAPHAQRPLGPPLVLVLDQFEELFIQHPELAQTPPDQLLKLAALISAGRPPEEITPGQWVAAVLVALVNSPTSPVNIVLSLREEGLASLDVFRDIVPNLFSTLFRVERLGEQGVREAIDVPLQRWSADFDGDFTASRALVLAILHDDTLRVREAVRGTATVARYETLFLQMALEYLWQTDIPQSAPEGGKKGGQLRYESYDAAGGAEGIRRKFVGETLRAHLGGDLDWFLEASRLLVSRTQKFPWIASELAAEIAAPLERTGRKPPTGQQIAATFRKLTATRLVTELAYLERDPAQEWDGRFQIAHDALAGDIYLWRLEQRKDAERKLLQRAAEEQRRRQQTRAFQVLAAVIFAALLGTGRLWWLAEERSQEATRQAILAEHQRSKAVVQTRKTAAALNAEGAALRAEKAAREQLDRQRTEVQEQLDRARESLEDQREAVQASKAAFEGISQLEQTLRARLSETERGYFTAALKDLRTALGLAEANEKVATELVQTSEQLAVAATGLTIAPPRLVAVLTGHAKPITALAFSPADATPGFLATAGKDNFVRVWNRAGEKINQVQGSSRDGVKAVAFSPDGQQLAIGSNGSTVRVYDLPSGEHFEYRGHEDTITSVSFSPDSSRLLSSSADRTVQVWTKANGLQQKLGPLKSIVTCAVFDPDATRVLASLDDPDEAAILWTPIGDGFSLTLTLKMKAPVKRAVFSPDGQLALTAGSGDKTAALWKVADGSPAPVLRGHTGPVFQAVFNPAGDRVATASGDKTARIWEVGDGRVYAVLAGHDAAVRHVFFSPDSTYLLTASDDGTARLWLPGEREARHVLRGHTGPITALAVSRDSRMIATGSEDGTVRLWETELSSVDADPATGLQTGWSLYGYLDSNDPEKVRMRSFSRSGDADQRALPALGEIVTAEAHMNIRSSISRGPDGKWKQGKPIGLLKKDSKARVLEILKGEPPLVWMRFESVSP